MKRVIIGAIIFSMIAFLICYFVLVSRGTDDTGVLKGGSIYNYAPARAVVLHVASAFVSASIGSFFS